MDLMTAEEAASVLGVSRRRIQALVDAGKLHSEQPGSRLRLFAPSDIEMLKRTMYRHAGRPLSQRQAWKMISDLDLPRSSTALDDLRRRLRARAVHRYCWQHPSWIADVRRGLGVLFPLVLGGSDAAAHHGVPVGGPSSPFHGYTTEHGATFLPSRSTPAGEANLVVHVVDEDIISKFDRYMPLAVAWLDMTDDNERGAEMVQRALR